MDTDIFEQLRDEGLITQEELAATMQQEHTKLFSLHWDLRSLLYSGILMLATGIGILIYKNIDAIGHLTVVIAAGVLSAVCLGYCFRHVHPFSREKIESPNLWFDYILLLGSLLMVTFLGYLQFQFHVFGMRWGLATFIPTVLLFGIAYYFDHRGVLSMAITSLAAWFGVAIDPMQLATSHNFASENYVWSGITLGVTLSILYILSGRLNIKAHFAMLYKNFSMHVLMLSLISAMFVFEGSFLLWFLVLAAVVAYQFIDAVKIRSFYFLLFSVIYGYIGLSGFIIKALLLAQQMDEGILYLLIFYFIGSAIGVIILLRHYNQKFHVR